MASSVTPASIAETPIRPFHNRTFSQGIVKSFDSSQGLGWIRPEDGSSDVSVKLSSISTTIKSLFPGQKIAYTVGDEKVAVAVDVAPEAGKSMPNFLRLLH